MAYQGLVTNIGMMDKCLAHYGSRFTKMKRITRIRIKQKSRAKLGTQKELEWQRGP